MRRDSRSRKSTCQPLSFPRCRFGHSVLTTSAASRITHLTWVHFHSSYWLPSTYPTCGCKEELPLAIRFPSSGLCYIVRLATLFRVLGASGDTDGSLLSRCARFIRPQVARPKASYEGTFTFVNTKGLLPSHHSSGYFGRVMVSRIKAIALKSLQKRNLI